jgi:hypothetical protein
MRGMHAAAVAFRVPRTFSSGSLDARSTNHESVAPDMAGKNGGSETPVPTILQFHDEPVQNPWITSIKLACAVRRFAKGSFLKLKLEGASCFLPLHDTLCGNTLIKSMESSVL